MEYKKHTGRAIRHAIAAPIIWFMIVPIVLLDICIELYHRTCFPLYGLECIKRKDYVKMDRYKLPHLVWYDKIFCWYCEYANGVLQYSGAIAARTEKFWCGIKHKQEKGYVEPKHHKEFIKYNDKKSYKKACKMQK